MLKYAHGMVNTIVDIAKFFYIDISKEYYSSIAIFFLIFSAISLLIFYIFKSISLFKMAKNNKMKASWLAFIPFANYYLIGKMTGKVRFLGVTFSNIGVLFGSFFAVIFGLYVFIDIYEVSGDFIRLVRYNEYDSIIVEKTKFHSYLTVLSLVMQLISVVILFVMTLSFFAKYERNKAKLYTIIVCLAFIFSSFELFIPILAVLIFAVRKKEPFDIATYLRMRNEAIMKIQEQYNQVDPFDEYKSDGSTNSGSALNQDVFSDFSVSKTNYYDQNSNLNNNTNVNSLEGNSFGNNNNSNENNQQNSQSDDDDLFG